MLGVAVNEEDIRGGLDIMLGGTVLGEEDIGGGLEIMLGVIVREKNSGGELGAWLGDKVL